MNLIRESLEQSRRVGFWADIVGCIVTAILILVALVLTA
jgi:hypothetical protein